MGSTILNAINMTATDVHAVGSLNNWKKNAVNLGVKVDESLDRLDNWSLVKLGFNQEGERVCLDLINSADPAQAYLVAAVEDYMDEYESIKNFYNVAGERIRVIKLEPGMRFECSNFEPNNPDITTHAYKNGQTAHFKVDTGVFIINNDVEHGEYAAATNKFMIVDAEGNYLDGQKTIRFEVIK